MLDESLNPLDENEFDARLETDLKRYLSDGQLDDAELDNLTNELASFDELPPERRNEQRRRFLSEFHKEVISIEATNGPIPPPTMLAGYEDVLPGAADRILTMAEKQQSHRFLIESEVVSSNVISERIGVIAGAVIALILIVGSMVLIAIGKSLEGMSVIVAEAAVLVYAFNKTKAAGANELQKKSDQADSNDIQPHKPE